jgi:DNA replication initiation complex subunit (GINS family)
MAVKKGVKKAAARKASPKPKTGGKRTAKAGKSAAKSKPAAKAGAEKSAPTSQPAKTEKAKKKAKGKVSSMKVNVGHILSLRPRVSPSFRQADFLTARHLLQDEAYANIEEAARAVAEKALEMTHEGPSKRGFKPGR